MRELIDTVDFGEPIRSTEDMALVVAEICAYQGRNQIHADQALISTTSGKAYLYKEE